MTRRLPTIRLAVALAAAGLLTTAGRGAEPTLHLGDDPNPATAKEVKNILLRPNSVTPFYPYVDNATPNDRTVTAVLLNAAGREIARSGEINVAANSRAPVTFSAPAPAPVPAGAPAAPAAGPIALTGPQVRLQLLDKNKEIGRSDLDVVSQTPPTYADATAAFTGARDAKNELTVKIEVKPVAGGPVKAKLDLSRVPGLVATTIKDGAFSGEAPATGGTIVLVARNLRFTGAPRKGWIAVTVDGYERAFLFETAFDGSTPLRPPVVDTVKVNCEPTAQPSEKFPVAIEVDQPSAAVAATGYIEFGFDKSGTGAYENRILPGDRQRAVTLQLGGPDGALTFGNTVKDWAFNLDTTGILGPRTLRARLLVPKGPTRDPAVDTELRADVQKVMFDNSPPDVKVSAPKENSKGKSVKVTVAAADAESGIDRVLVFIGDAPPADVRNPVRGKVYLATPPATAGGAFTLALPTPDTKGPIAVGARVINGAGLSTDAAAEVNLVDPPADAAKTTTGIIKGVVVEGEPPRKQAGKTVLLLDEKYTTTLKQTQSNDKGEFTFKDVPPGNYIVRADKPADYGTARKPVTVEAGKTTEVELDIKRARSKK